MFGGKAGLPFSSCVGKPDWQRQHGASAPPLPQASAPIPANSSRPPCRVLPPLALEPANQVLHCAVGGEGGQLAAQVGLAQLNHLAVGERLGNG